MKLLLDSLLNTHIFTQTYLFRMLLVESARLIFGTSSLVGLGQEGQRSNKKQAKFQFSEQTSPPFEVSNTITLNELLGSIFKSIWIFWGWRGCLWAEQLVHVWFMANSPFPILATQTEHTRTHMHTHLLQQQPNPTVCQNKRALHCHVPQPSEQPCFL